MHLCRQHDHERFHCTAHKFPYELQSESPAMLIRMHCACRDWSGMSAGGRTSAVPGRSFRGARRARCGSPEKGGPRSGQRPWWSGSQEKGGARSGRHPWRRGRREKPAHPSIQRRGRGEQPDLQQEQVQGETVKVKGWYWVSYPHCHYYASCFIMDGGDKIHPGQR